MIFIDTDVAIAVRDGDAETRQKVLALDSIPVISVMTRVELENGVNREPAGTSYRRRSLDRLLHTIAVEMFTHADILAYGAIVHDIGYHRQRTLDRLIAAQAITRGATLITRNGKHFREIGELKLEVW